MSISDNSAVGHSPNGRAGAKRAGGKASKPEPWTHDEAASLIVGALRSGEPIAAEAKARMSLDWQSGATAARAGEESFRAWLDRTLPGRLADDPALLTAIREAAGRALADPPPTIPLPGVAPAPPRRMKILGATDLHNADFRVEWLIKRVLVADQPCVVAAPKKSLKTSVMIDLAVSLATATPLLGHFEVPRPRKVLFLSGEAGGFEVRNRIDRVCRSRDCTLPDLEGNLFIALEDLPRITEADDLSELAEVIKETGAEVVILDPLYLCLMSGHRPVDAANLMQMGPVLAALNRACREHGATLILVHHMRKTTANGERKDEIGGEASQPELEDIAYAGVQEFARQWIMLKRRRRYEPGTGQHHVWFSTGGSAISGGCWAVDIAEGVQADDFTGQYWAPTVIPEREAIANEQAERAAAKRGKEQAKELGDVEKYRRHDEKLIAYLATLAEPKPKNYVLDNAHLNSRDGDATINRLLDAGRITIEERGRTKFVALIGIQTPSA